MIKLILFFFFLTAYADSCSDLFSSGEIGFFDALQFIEKSLPEGELKTDFAEKIKDIKENDLISLKELEDPIFKKNRIKRGLIGVHVGKKIMWHKEKPENPLEQMHMMFDAIRIVYELNYPRLSFFSVYKNSRKKYVQTFLNLAEKILNVQNSLYNAAFSESDLKILPRSQNKILATRFYRIFRFFLWRGRQKTFRDLNLDAQTKDLLDQGDQEGFEKLLHSRYSTEVSILWYMRHFKNVRKAIRNALIVGLAVELGTALFEYHDPEDEFTSKDFITAVQIMQPSEQELQKEILDEAKNLNLTDLNSAEINFLNSVKTEIQKTNDLSQSSTINP